MDGKPFLVDVRLNGDWFTQATVDNGCQSYATISESLVEQHELPRITINPRILDGVLADIGQITEITYASVDIHGHKQKRIFFYVIPGQTDPILLGDPWMQDVDACYSAKKGCLKIRSTGTICYNRAIAGMGPQGCKPLKLKRANARQLEDWARNNKTKILATSMADIEIALRPKKRIDYDKLPRWLNDLKDAFSQDSQ